jgi:hypothetical protein
MDRFTTQRLIIAAIREQRLPGKYDVFAWSNGQSLQALTVAWKSYTRRAIALESTVGDNGDEIVTNGVALPNGIAKNRARYVGTFRIEAPSRRI